MTLFNNAIFYRESNKIFDSKFNVISDYLPPLVRNISSIPFPLKTSYIILNSPLSDIYNIKPFPIVHFNNNKINKNNMPHQICTNL